MSNNSLSLEEKQTLKFRINTAVETTIINKKCYESLKCKPPLYKCNIPVRGLLGKPELPVGLITLPVQYNGKKFNVTCQVMNSFVPNLLSASDSVKMSLVKRVYFVNNDVPSERTVLMKEFADVFQCVGRVPGEHGLNVDHNVPR